MDDFTTIYQKIHNINKRLYNLEPNHPNMEVNYNMKILEYTLTYDGGDVFANRTDNEIISQYDIVGIKATLVDFPEDNYAVRLHVSSASYSDSNEESLEDFQFHNYMTPIREDINKFLISLNKTLGDYITIGAANTVPVMFSVLNETDELESDITNIELYKTNTAQNYTVNDLTSVFIKLNEIEERLEKLEE